MNTYHTNLLPTRTAVLIDGDNIPSRKLDEIVRYAANYGVLTIRKVFGDWTRQSLSGWKSASSRYGFRLEQATAYTSGKNTSDLAIVMEAMDIMYQQLAETVCIASSDGDFTGLTQRLRESGIQVLGFGASQTPESLMSSCSSFLCTGHVVAGLPSCAASAGTATGAKGSAKDKKGSSQRIARMEEKTKSLIHRDRETFLQIFKEAAKGKKTADIADISNLILKEFKKFRVKDYGCNKTARIYEVLGFSIKKEKNKTFIQMPAGGIR